MADQLFIQRRFKIKEGKYDLSDSLIIPLTEYNALSEGEISSLKEDRFTAFKNYIDNPPVFPQPTDEEILTEIDKQIEILASKRAEVEPRVSNKPSKNATVDYHKGGN